jgi:hypothetical protein
MRYGTEGAAGFALMAGGSSNKIVTFGWPWYPFSTVTSTATLHLPALPYTNISLYISLLQLEDDKDLELDSAMDG